MVAVIRVDFTVYGQTLAEIQTKADERLFEFAPGRQWTKVDIDSRPIAMFVDGSPVAWEGNVEAVS